MKPINDITIAKELLLGVMDKETASIAMELITSGDLEKLLTNPRIDNAWRRAKSIDSFVWFLFNKSE